MDTSRLDMVPPGRSPVRGDCRGRARPRGSLEGVYLQGVRGLLLPRVIGGCPSEGTASGQDRPRIHQSRRRNRITRAKGKRARISFAETAASSPPGPPIPGASPVSERPFVSPMTPSSRSNSTVTLPLIASSRSSALGLPPSPLGHRGASYPGNPGKSPSPPGENLPEGVDLGRFFPQDSSYQFEGLDHIAPANDPISTGAVIRPPPSG